LVVDVDKSRVRGTKGKEPQQQADIIKNTITIMEGFSKTLPFNQLKK